MYKKLKERGTKFHKQWQEMLDTMVQNPEFFPEELHRHENEMITSKFMTGNSIIRVTLGMWLDSIQEHTLNNAEMSNNYREEGNRLFRINKIENSYSAQNNYTKAIFGAPDAKLAALCHANRAAALIQIGFYEEAYNDCECAIELGYPTENRDKIYARQATCAVALKDSEKLKFSLEKLRKSNRMNKEIEEFTKKFEELQTNAETNGKKTNETMPHEKQQKILHSQEKGKYVVADEKILENDHIMSEKAFAFVPVYGNNLQVIDSNCQNCGEVNIIPFPCYDCSKVCYCSPKCRISHKAIHEFECNGVKKLLFFEIGIGHLAFRTFLNGFPTLIGYILKTTPRKPMKLMEMWLKVLEFSEKDNSQYANIMKLITNFDKMDIEDYLRYSLTGTMLTVYLSTMTKFLKKSITRECYKIMPNNLDWEILISALITRHLGQMICNAHTISGLRLSVDKRLNIFQTKNRLLVGKLRYYFEIVSFYAAIYPRICLYNHACEPNFRNHFNGINLNILATNDLNKGDEILNCYGKHYKKIPKSIRSAELNGQYHFKCKCLHCTTKNDSEYKRFHSLQCNRKPCNNIFYPENLQGNWWEAEIFERNFKIICPKCRNLFNFQWYHEYTDLMRKLMFLPNRKLSSLDRICELYNCGKTILVGAHPMKLNMIMMGIEHAIIALSVENGRFNKKVYGKFIKMAIDWLNYTEELHGYYDLEYVSVATHILDMLVMIKSHGVTMKFDYDLMKIKKSFEILPNQTKIIFENYFNDFVREMI